MSGAKTLDQLWNQVNILNKRHFSSNNLAPIIGNGKTSSPDIMFVFINPTARNISSDPGWKGPRFPFIGTKQVWRIFHRAGLFDDGLMEYMENNPHWSLDFTGKVLRFLKRKSFYITNIVKWTGEDATLPNSEKIKLFLPILLREIELVRPRHIVTFGLIPFENLTGQKIKLSEYYAGVKKSGKLKTYDLVIDSTRSKVIPCYFPVGRGDPKKAVEILKMLCALE
ncbi:MAG: uracil-DNA glycosylase family protein [Candidatus Woesearchaeota archaeon]